MCITEHNDCHYTHLPWAWLDGGSDTFFSDQSCMQRHPNQYEDVEESRATPASPILPPCFTDHHFRKIELSQAAWPELLISLYNGYKVPLELRGQEVLGGYRRR